MSYEEPPLRRSRYRRFTDDLSSCTYRCLLVFMGVMGGYRCMGVYRYLRESIGVHGYSDVNQRHRVLRRTAAAKES